jgi:DNA (cytosine-5)-methyltransferase 1
MNYGSVCSGIEAATVAWEGLGWQAEWFSQYDPENDYSKGLDFPSRLLKHYYPDVENLGDMTKVYEKEKFKNTAIDLLVGGTPCQSFSVAGLRGGLGDQRGNLSLEYCRILIAKQPRWFVWENVPGVYSSFSDDEESKVYLDGSDGAGGGIGGGVRLCSNLRFCNLVTRISGMRSKHEEYDSCSE